MKKYQIVTVIRSLLILLFLYAAFSKLGTYEEFKVQLTRSPYIVKFADITAWALPTGEILVALALLLPRFNLLGLFGSLFLMSLFTAYIYTMLHYSYYTPCSCGGVLSKMGWTTHLYFNIAFILLSIIGIILYEPKIPEEKSYQASLSFA